MNLVTVVQARTGSSRLPGKILLDLAGEPLLARMVQRVQAARHAGQVVVATTTEASDNVVVELCREYGFPCFRGHPTDLLDRHYQTGKAWGAEAVVKIPSDCPLIDPRIIDEVLGVYLAQPTHWDFVSNLHPGTWPDGNDVEIMPMPVLETAWREAENPMHREHTTPYIWDQPERFRLRNVEWAAGRNLAMTHRWTIDYPEDYALIRQVYAHLYPEKGIHFSLADILELLERHPWIHALNEQYAGVNWYRHHLGELKTVSAQETRLLDEAQAPREAGYPGPQQAQESKSEKS